MIDARTLPLGDGSRTLRPLAERDAARYAEGTRDEAVIRWAHLPEPTYTTTSVARIARDVVPAGLARGDLALLAVVDQDDLLVGSLVLFGVTSTTGEVGFWLRADARGTGHAAGALALARTLAVRCGLTTLTARTSPDNAASGRALARAGFIPVRTDVDRAPSGASVPLIHHELRLTASSDQAPSDDVAG
ncbi:GNAT family N-acetyltransferase [Georgenia sp. Z1491]|uniref:GNAT family N-acetyltransferase n=1 Tax=Georgenia sp. Z1491 TaxID=3416707 RepID=UPI003CF35B97